MKKRIISLEKTQIMIFETKNKHNHQVAINPTFIQFPVKGKQGNSEVREWYMKTISYSQIKKITHEFGDPQITFDTSEFFTLNFGDSDQARAMYDLLKANITEAEVKEKQLTSIQASWGFFLAFLIFIGITYAAYDLASAIDSGEVRYRGGGLLKSIVYFIPYILGPIGTAIVGGIITLLIGLTAVARFKKPPVRARIHPTAKSKVEID
ncbi:MAG: hypothetical protein ABJG68_04540 [Crocinitomicaceae bacterium]